MRCFDPPALPAALLALSVVLALGGCAAREPALPDPRPPEAPREPAPEEGDPPLLGEPVDGAREEEPEAREEEPEAREPEASPEEVEDDVVEPTPPGDRAARAVLPRRRIVAFYGNPQSTRMGILGELPVDEMLALLDREVAAWEEADPATQVQPALHLIAVMAAADPGPDSLYRVRLPSAVIERVLSWAERRSALVFLDIQPGRSTVERELPRLVPYLRRDDVHLALDPEWAMRPDQLPARVIGSMDASDVNHAISVLSRIVEEEDLAPKVLVVHRFTGPMLTNAHRIRRDPNVQVVLNMDGWGSPAQKRATYNNFVARAPVEFKGFKLFYRNDARAGSRLLTPDEILSLTPRPIYIQYQ